MEALGVTPAELEGPDDLLACPPPAVRRQQAQEGLVAAASRSEGLTSMALFRVAGRFAEQGNTRM